MSSASDSGERIATRDNRVPDWFAKLVIACMSTVACGMGTWAIKSTQDHEGRIIRLETELAGTKDLLKEIRQDIKEMKDRLERRP